MQSADYLVILMFVVGIAGAALVFTRRMKNAAEMFSAGGQSPWWVSGLSGFMTMFSAGTFVVWGGIAYRWGFVAVAINMCYGIAALLVGWFLAGVWRRYGVASAAEFLQLRFGGSVVQFYTWFQGSISIFMVGGTIYALAKIVCALVPLADGNLLQDPATGMLSVTVTSVAICLLVMMIAGAGGLWAVLMTDVLQFVILAVSVVFVVPLVLMEAGGWSAFIAQAPPGFTQPVAADFSWWFLAGWVVIHFFKIGGEWSFVQRFTCVPTARDARKSAYLFGAMYLISPIFWMMPPLVYRVLNPEADYEQAYILACQLVLPAGMMGLMVAAMASATASVATSQLNVFAGAFTTEVYRRLINPQATERQMVFYGRVCTLVLGGVVITGAMLIPRYGYTSFILDLTALIVGPLVLPTIWGLFSRKIGVKAVWGTTLVGFATAAVVKFGLSAEGFLSGVTWLAGLSDWVIENQRLADLTSGILVPLATLGIMEVCVKQEHPGWARVQAVRADFHEAPMVTPSTMPARMVMVALAAIALLMIVLAAMTAEDRTVLLLFATVLGGIAAANWGFCRRLELRRSASEG